MAGEYLSFDDFIASFRFAPRVAIELVLTNASNETLYIARTQDPFVGFYHFPGGFLLKGESIREAIERIAEEELSFRLSSEDTHLTRLVENVAGDPRGHILHLVFEKRVSSSELNYLTGHTFFADMPEPFIAFEKLYTKEALDPQVWDVRPHRT